MYQTREDEASWDTDRKTYLRTCFRAFIPSILDDLLAGPSSVEEIHFDLSFDALFEEPRSIFILFRCFLELLLVGVLVQKGARSDNCVFS